MKKYLLATILTVAALSLSGCVGIEYDETEAAYEKNKHLFSCGIGRVGLSCDPFARPYTEAE